MKIDREQSNKNKKGIRLVPILLSMVMIGSGLSLTGYKSELAPDNSNLDMLNTNDNDTNAEGLSKGIEQIKDVEGETFKLVIKYYCGDKEWHINANKDLYISINTKDLPDNLEVYIDNIHTYYLQKQDIMV